MEIFYNQQRSGYEEIVSYGPRWWTEYREMDAVYRFAGRTLDLMAYFLERVIKNQFVMQADEGTISMLEGIFGIEYDAGLTLDERRRIVAMYYAGSWHLSRSVILAMVKSYTGHDGEVYWDGLTLCIKFSYGGSEKDLSIIYLKKNLERRKPAHIPFRLVLEMSIKGQINIGIVMQQAEILHIRQVN